MSSKQLESILSKVPAATAAGETNNVTTSDKNKKQDTNILNCERIVAQIPRTLKDEIRDYIKLHKGETEKTIILKSLKLMGFNVPSTWLIDKRKLR